MAQGRILFRRILSSRYGAVIVASTASSVQSTAYESIVAALEEVVNKLPLTACPALVGELERLKFMTVSRIMAQQGASEKVDNQHLLTIREVAKQLKVSEYRAYELARQGMIQSVRLGRSVRVRPTALAEYLMGQGS
jgi:excisionase family DNA binding protein